MRELHDILRKVVLEKWLLHAGLFGGEAFLVKLQVYFNWRWEGLDLSEPSWESLATEFP